MVTTAPHDDTDTVVQPSWPEPNQDGGGVVDVREDTSRPYVAPEQMEPVRRGLRARRALGWILAAAILGIVAIVASVNRVGEIGIDLVVDDGLLPLWGVIAGAAALGFAAGRFLDDGC